MNPEHGYREIKSPERIFGPGFDPKEIQGLFLNRGKEKQIIIFHEEFEQVGLELNNVLIDTLQVLNSVDAKIQSLYFPNNFIFEFGRKLGQRGLDLLFQTMKKKGFEWGTQIQPEQVTQKLAKQMKESGCSYVALNAPTAVRELLLASGHPETTMENFKRAVDYLDEQDIRIGLNLEIGIQGEAKKSGTNFKVFETQQSVMQSISFIKSFLRQGKNIVAVKLGIFDDPNGQKVDHVKYPYNRFYNSETAKTQYNAKFLDMAVATAVKEIGEVLKGQDVYSVDTVYRKAREGKLADFIDFNSASISTPVFSSREKRALDSLQVDPVHVKSALEKTNFQSRFQNSLLGANDSVFAIDYLHKNFYNSVNRARYLLARLMGVKGKEKWPKFSLKDFKKAEGAIIADEHIAIAPNTTQAINWALAMVVIEEKLFVTDKDNNYIITDAEHYSAHRLMRSLSDKANLHGRELAASFQDFGQKYSYAISSSPNKARVQWREEQAKVLAGGSEYNIAAKVDANTKMVVLSHVVRDTGEILDVKKITKAIKSRNPNCWVLIDGAQAFGALPKFSIPDLGCDFYVATPHKTLNSYPFGVLYMSDRAVNLAPKLILERQHGKISVQVPKEAFSLVTEVRDMSEPKAMAVKDGFISPREPASLVLNFFPKDRLVDKDDKIEFPDSTLEERLDQEMYNGMNNKLAKNEEIRAGLKNYMLNSFSKVFGQNIEILSPQDAKHSNFILSFTFPGLDNRAIVEDLWTNYHIGLTYIARSNCIRSSFSPFNTNTEIDKLVEALKKVTQNPQYKINL